MEEKGLWEEEKKPGVVDSVYVVKSVNIYQGEILPDDMGIGVYLTYEEAKICYEANVLELKTFYDKDSEYVGTWEEGSDEYEDFRFCIFDKETMDGDFVALYRCKVGMWNDMLDIRTLKENVKRFKTEELIEREMEKEPPLWQ